MRVVNRTAVTLRGVEPYVAWARAHDADGNRGALTVAPATVHGSVFLLPEFDFEEDLQEWVEENHAWLFEFQLAAWTDEDMQAYIDANGVLVNPLVDEGYPSIGCMPCTDRVRPGVVYTTFHFPESGANVVTTENSDWATNCPEYKVTAVQAVLVTEPASWRLSHDTHHPVAMAVGSRQ